MEVAHDHSRIVDVPALAKNDSIDARRCIAPSCQMNARVLPPVVLLWPTT
jgi:hypothetical protein